MDNPHSPAPLRESDYEAIEAAVMETEKGRWFLAEYARRNRSADTEAVLAAIAGLERLMHRERRPDVDRIRLDVAEMKDAIDRTKAEIADIRQDGADGSRFAQATSELDSIITQTEAATSDILGAAEKLQEVAWTMREGGMEGEVCDAIEALVMTIYEACSFQDLTGQRTQKVVRVLRFLESRINAMVAIWGLDGADAPAPRADGPERPDAHLLNGPAAPGEGIAQVDVDQLFEGLDIDWAEPEFEPVAALPAPVFLAADAETAVDLVAPPADTVPADDVLAAAEVAMDEAIETLREVSGSLSAADEDPFDRLTRAERQALFS